MSSLYPNPHVFSPTVDRAAGETIRTHELGNGLRLLAIERIGAPLVSCRLYHAAGSRHDDGRGGRAHLTEHCMVQATLADGGATAALEAAGAELDAGTHREHLHFSVTALPTDLLVAVEALGEIWRQPPIQDELVRREKAVIHQEQEQHRDGLSALWDVMMQELWEDHPVVLPPVGGPDLFTLTGRDLEEHQARLIRPERSVLAIVGQLASWDDLVEQAERAFGRWRRGDAGAVPGDHPPTPRNEPRWVRQPADLQHCYFMLGWPVSPVGSAHDPALTLLTRILGEGDDALLKAQLRAMNTELYTIQADLLQYRDSGILAILGSCPRPQLDAVLTGVMETVFALGSGPLLREECLGRQQSSYAASVARAYETVSSRAGALGELGLCGLYQPLEDRVAAVTSLDLRALRACADRLLVDVVPSVAVLGA